MASGRLGLVLTGGGARGAYQAGALSAIAELTRRRALPFSVLAGSERTLRINQTLSFLAPDVLASQVVPLRHVELLILRPSIDPCQLVARVLDRFPGTLRCLFRGLGATPDAGWDLLSYLGFDGAYTTRLFELGYEDTLARARDVIEFCA